VITEGKKIHTTQALNMWKLRRVKYRGSGDSSVVQHLPSKWIQSSIPQKKKKEIKIKIKLVYTTNT
jgi:hypothetical protein